MMSLLAETPDPCLPGGADALVASVTVRVVAQLPVARVAALDDAAGLLGASLELSGPPSAATVADGPWLLEADAVLALPDEQRAHLVQVTAGVPVLLFGRDLASGAALAEAAAALTGQPLGLVPGGAPSRFKIAGGLPALEPFGGHPLEEAIPRELPQLLDPDPRGLEPLITCEGGGVLGRVRRPAGGELWVCAAPPLHRLPEGGLLRKRFEPGDFLDLMPLLAFLRHALGERAWRRERCQAAFMIDDPNLRRDRYGWVDYVALRDAGRRHGFHTSIAMAPIDAGKTQARTAELFRGSAELSLVMHGVYHTHHEFAQHVSAARADQDLGFGFDAMEAHRVRHGVACPAVMTFPFSRCSSEWMRAMRDAGLTAAVTGPNPFPFLAEFGVIADPAFGMLPAEMGHGGFPVLARSFLTQPREDLLFSAWLGRPLIIYLHHDDLREGVTPLTEIADFVNRRLAVQWTDLGTIAAGNHQRRRTAAGWLTRMFSAEIALPGGELPIAAALKPGAERQADERVWADGSEVAAQRIPGVGLLAPLPQRTRIVRAGPRFDRSSATRRPARAGLAYGRRGLTELRDRLAPTADRLFGGEQHEPSSFPTFTG